MINKLKQIEAETNFKFVESKNDIVKFISSGQIISIDLMTYQEIPKPGLYLISEGTCSGKCTIGEPNLECVKEGTYSKRKCAVYYFRPLHQCSIKLMTVLKLMSN